MSKTTGPASTPGGRHSDSSSSEEPTDPAQRSQRAHLVEARLSIGKHPMHIVAVHHELCEASELAQTWQSANVEIDVFELNVYQPGQSCGQIMEKLVAHEGHIAQGKLGELGAAQTPYVVLVR
eukprot:scaffold93202_cov39-Prasinocladus_malaysianus.AAC.1